MCADSTLGRLSATGRRFVLNSAAVVLITLVGAQIHAAPAAAQAGGKDTQATQEEEALDDLLTDEEEIKFKREPPPAGSVGGNKWDDPTSSQEAPSGPVDPEQVITSPTNIDPARDPLSKEEKHAAQIYVDDEIKKRLARAAGRVPDEDIEHHVVYTPSPAAQQDPNRKAFEQQLWKQRLADYKQAKLAERLLKDLDSAGPGPAVGTASTSGADNGTTSDHGGAAASGESSGGESGSLLERLLGAGGSGASKPGATGQSDTGAGRDGGAGGTAGTAANNDRSAQDPNSLDQNAGSAPKESGQQPLGTVTLGEPPPAPRGQSTAFDKFVSQSGILGQPSAATGSDTSAERGAASTGSEARAAARSENSGAGNAGPGVGQFAAVPKPKPLPAQPGTASATASAGSSGAEFAGSRGGDAANVANSPAPAGPSGSQPGSQSAQAPQGSASGSKPTLGPSGQDGSAPPTPLGDLLAAATAALERAGPPDGSLPAPVPLPEASDPSPAPAQAAAQSATAASEKAATKTGDHVEDASVADAPDAPAEQSGSSAKSFADQFSFSRDIAALSPDAKDLAPSATETTADEPERPRRQEFERTAMEKFIAKQPLDPAEQEFIAAARQASAAKSEDQINDQARNAAELQATATAVREDVDAVIEASEDSNKLAYLQPAANANNSDSQTVQAGAQAIEVATNRASGRSTPKIANRQHEIADRKPESDPSVKLFRPEKLKSAKPAPDLDEGTSRPEDQAATRRDRQARQSERLAAKLEREARHETTKVRFDNCVLFIFCSLTKLVLPQTSPEEPEPGAPVGSGEGVQRVRP